MQILNDLHAFIWRSYPDNCNTYLINGNKKILIDPGYEQLFDNINGELASINISRGDIDVVIATHGHPDHLEAVRLFSRPTLFSMNAKEYQFISQYEHNLNIPKPDYFLDEGELTIGNNHFQVIYTPGHSPGSVCLYWPCAKVLFTGDLVFNRAIGSTDFPGGDDELLKESIRKIATLDVNYLLPGHRDILVGKEVIKTNFQMVEDFCFNHKTSRFF